MGKYNLLFLDFDGVITTLESKWEICPEKIKLLNKIVEQTDCRIVVSSTWRLNKTVEELQELLDGKGFTGRVIGKTPSLPYIKFEDSPIQFCRGEEIKYFLQKMTERGNIKSYCIVDDDQDFLYTQRNNFVNTDSFKGISEQDIEKVINILNREIK
jgi:hypothetical protein